MAIAEQRKHVAYPELLRRGPPKVCKTHQNTTAAQCVQRHSSQLQLDHQLIAKKIRGVRTTKQVSTQVLRNDRAFHLGLTGHSCSSGWAHGASIRHRGRQHKMMLRDDDADDFETPEPHRTTGGLERGETVPTIFFRAPFYVRPTCPTVGTYLNAYRSGSRLGALAIARSNTSPNGSALGPTRQRRHGPDPKRGAGNGSLQGNRQHTPPAAPPQAAAGHPRS